MTSWFNGLMGKAVAPTQELSVSTLLERVQNATTTEDRRKAISDLRTMTDNPTHVTTIGTEGLPILMKRLRNDRTDVDGTRGIIQLLISIMSVSGSELRTVPLRTPQYENIARFVKDPFNAAIILSLLEENDRNIRYFSTKLLTYLLANKGAEIEAAVLQSGANITRLMDLLKLGNEMIRNEALLLLIEITKTNVEIQKVVAYENGFENLLGIIESEGMANGGIVVQDCLTLINNLLANNPANQNQFREMNCIKRLPDLLKIDPSDLWTLSDDKRDILNLTLTAISALLNSPASTPVSIQTVPSPKDSTSSLTVTSTLSSQIQSTQTQLGVHRVHARVIELALGELKAPTVRIKALWCLGDLIFNHPQNRQFLEQHDFKAHQGNGRVSALLKVTQVLFTSKIPMESLAAHHLLKCYFHSNPEGQRIFAAPIASPHAAAAAASTSASPASQSGKTLLQNDLSEAYPGRLIVKSLLSWESNNDMAKTFHAAMALGYIIESNPGVKTQLLKHMITEASASSSQVSSPENLLAFLLKSFLRSLNSELPIIVAFLRVISVWIEDCPAAVAQARAAPPAFVSALLELVNTPSTSVHIAGIAAFLIGLCSDLPSEYPTLGIGDNGSRLVARLDALRRSPELLQVEKGGPRLHDEESKLPFYDSSFVVSFLKLMLRLSPTTLLPQSATTPPPPQSAVTTISTSPAPTVPVASALPPSIHGNHHPTHVNGSAHQHMVQHVNHHHPVVPHGHGHTHAVANPVHHPHPHPPHQPSNHFHHPHAHLPPSNGSLTPTTTSPDGSSMAELESLRTQLASLLQAQRVWQQEKQGLETHLHQLQGHVNHLQSQLQSKQSQCESLVSQLTTLQQSSSTSLQQDSGLQQKYDSLKAEYDSFMAHHEDLLVMLGEKEDENEALRAQLSGVNGAPHQTENDELL